MARFNTKTPSTKTYNLAGGEAYSMRPEAELLHGVLTTFLENKFYEGAGERVNRLRSLVGQVQPDFVAKLAKVARTEFHLRSVSHLLLGELTLQHNTGNDLVKRAVVATTQRPDDLLEYASYVMANTENNSLTKQAKRGIRNALLKFDGYQLAKYRGEGKSLSMVDLFNLTHPRTGDPEQAEAWRKLMKGELTTTGQTWESNISNAESGEERTREWEKMVLDGNIGYMALLRNLNNLIKYKVSDEVIQKAADTIRDPERVKKSKQLPFRFYTAYNEVKGSRVLTDAISEAMDIAVENAPVFEGKTLVAVDSSGSMGGYYSSADSPITKASLLGAAIMKKNPGADLILYDTRIKELTVSGRTPVLDIVREIKNQAMGGGTKTGLVFDYASENGTKYDRVIILSDNASWQGSVQECLNRYMRTTDANPYVFAIDIEGYGTRDINHPKAFHTCGFSDRILDFIGQVEKTDSLLEYVKQQEI